jgi:hypothetical protein
MLPRDRSLSAALLEAFLKRGPARPSTRLSRRWLPVHSKYIYSCIHIIRGGPSDLRNWKTPNLVHARRSGAQRLPLSAFSGELSQGTAARPTPYPPCQPSSSFPCQPSSKIPSLRPPPPLVHLCPSTTPWASPNPSFHGLVTCYDKADSSALLPHRRLPQECLVCHAPRTGGRSWRRGRRRRCGP